MPRLVTSLKFGLEYAGFQLAALILGSLSVEAASNLSGSIWRKLAPRFRRHERALAHLASAFPELSSDEREAIAIAMWENLGRTFGEAFHLKEIAASGRVTIENQAIFEDWAAREGGKVACAGHLGNWELAILGISQRGLKPWSIYQRIKNPYVDRRVAGMRGFLYTGGLVQKNPALPRLFMRVLREGGTIGFLADLREFSGVDVPFFGRLAPSTTFPALLARSVNAPILMVRMQRLPGVRFVQSFELIQTPITEDRKADVTNATAMIHAAFERYIRDRPEQWMWAHRRWG
ncbi:lauroyl acyltransferase [Lichenihabitans sp. PAMC28606]|uniref:lysophospholipid acyltransferase family protein n=1 Tax=Lichenihabitans sp. PAMC28606 TaxID=2880932 RepID=UPI001D0A9832|nr:lauroyl acyltransferase [Lichenihabitans sp. PAMC28606]UDL95457.1 lauroyl acyltransferase [Lichenihabitans sp. PAMC28606]